MIRSNGHTFTLASVLCLITFIGLALAVLASNRKVKALQREIAFPPKSVPGVARLYNVDSKSLVASVGEGCIYTIRFTHTKNGEVTHSDVAALSSGIYGIAFFHVSGTGDLGIVVDGSIYSYSVSMTAAPASMHGTGDGKYPHWTPVWKCRSPNRNESWGFEMQWSPKVPESE